MFKSKFILPLSCLLIAFSSCGETKTENNLEPIGDHPGVSWFDWNNDPLVVKLSESFESSLSADTVKFITDDLYDYFHYMNMCDSVSFEKHIQHFPEYLSSDTAVMNFQRDGLIKWKGKGMINTVEFCEIDYISDWEISKDQHIAIIDCTMDFYQHFMPNFEGNPEGMKFVLGERFGKDAITYTEEYRKSEEGDSILVRNWRAHTDNSMFVMYENSSDSVHFNFLPEETVNLRTDSVRLPRGAMLNLLRDLRERNKN